MAVLRQVDQNKQGGGAESLEKLKESGRAESCEDGFVSTHGIYRMHRTYAIAEIDRLQL